ANSEEGRALIIERMKTQTQADKIYFDALKEVYRHYGQGKITPEDAESIAEQISDSRIEGIRERASQIDEEIENLTGEQPRNINQNVPKGMVILLDPNGNPLHVPQEEVERLLTLGARLT
ncbi:MAG: hypothetical protein ACM3XP_04945, partial [Nitrososphaerales archaeon]